MSELEKIKRISIHGCNGRKDCPTCPLNLRGFCTTLIPESGSPIEFVFWIDRTYPQKSADTYLKLQLWKSMK